jgi:hypothetical protein
LEIIIYLLITQQVSVPARVSLRNFVLHKASEVTFLSCSHLHRNWVPCRHDTARPQVVDKGGGLQIWMVSANVLNKQSRTADTGWASSLGVRGEAKQLLTLNK